MQIENTHLSTHALVRLTGRFDFSTRDSFIASIKQTIAQTDAPEIRVDLTGVDYVDSFALGMLLMARDMAKQRDKEVTLSSPQPAVRRVLETAQFPRLFKGL
jgi:anti-anti-sigma factor